MTVAIVFLSLTVSAVFGWTAVGGVIRLVKIHGGAGPRPSSSGYRVTVPRERPARPHVLRGGAWIGALERLAMTDAILARQPETVAAVVAVKGPGRWADLQTNPALTGRFIIGTLVSYIAADAYGYVGLAPVGQP